MGVCEILETAKAVEGEKEKDSQLSSYGNSLQKLLRCVQELPDDFDKGGNQVLYVSRVVIACAGHWGAHYWTSPSNRQLANGKLILVC